jgi:glutathione S-transferase
VDTLQRVRLYSVPISTNVERVTLALAHKGLAVEHVEVPFDDRAEILRVSGQELVPVLVAGEEVVSDSTAILEWLETRFPEPPLYPTEPARCAETRLFIDWFNRVWKRPPNLIVAELERDESELELVGRYAAELRASLDVFESLLDGRDHLLGEFSVGDCVAFPFLKFGLLWTEDDPYLFHAVLRDNLSPDAHPRVAAWIRRVDARPRA